MTAAVLRCSGCAFLSAQGVALGLRHLSRRFAVCFRALEMFPSMMTFRGSRVVRKWNHSDMGELYHVPCILQGLRTFPMFVRINRMYLLWKMIVD
jgi:hypothetical protein